MLDALIGSSATYIFVFMRMTGMIGFNPMLTRQNVPGMVRTALIFAMTILVAPTVDASGIVLVGTIDMIFFMVVELFIGLVLGIVFQFFYYILFFVGDLLDMQFGMSMSKAFDPGTNIQISVTGNFLGIIFVLYVFATGGFHTLIQIFALSYEFVGIGAAQITQEFLKQVLEAFMLAFSLGIQLSLPFIAAEFVLEASMGILMKLIPQIHVFVINIQFKLLLGVSLLFLFASPIASFMDNYISIMFDELQRLLASMA